MDDNKAMLILILGFCLIVAIGSGVSRALNIWEAKIKTTNCTNCGCHERTKK